MLKITFFGFAGLFGILAGVSLRAYDFLGPSPQYEVQKYLAAGCNLEEAKYLMVAGRSIKTDSNDGDKSSLMSLVPGPTRTILFSWAAKSSTDSESLRPRSDHELAVTLENWRKEKQKIWEIAAIEVASQPKELQSSLALSLWKVLSQLP